MKFDSILPISTAATTAPLSDVMPNETTAWSKLGYRPAFDGLRGIAVLAVVIYHFSKIGDWRLLPGGYVGVDVFFALSGFLITCLLLEEWSANGKIDFKNFYLRRACRLLPALVVCLAFSFVLYCLADHSRWKLGLKQTAVVLLYVSNWVRAFGGRSFMGWFGHTWSLSVEEQFYLTWPIIFVALLWAFRTKRQAVLWVGLLAVGVMLYRGGLAHAGWTHQRLGNGSDTRADALLVGCFGAFVFHTRALSPQLLKWAEKIAIVTGILLLAYCVRSLSTTDPRLYLYGMAFISIASGLLVFSLAQSSPQSGIIRLLQLKLLVWLGRLSYAIYLWHMVFFSFARELFPSVSLWVRAPVCMALTLVVASASYYWVEKPFLRLKKRYTPQNIEQTAKA
ncbi:acyltransferase [bacterium]|nr:MAG: acyltransferase [bacterium]